MIERVSHDGVVSRTVTPARDAPPGAAPLRFPTDTDDRVRMPDDASVWVFADVHGVRSGLFAALVEAGIADIDGAWIAPPGTALVGLGDYIDRGADSAGVVKLLTSLQVEAAEAGSSVVLVRGNHEQMLVDLLHGDSTWAKDWLAKGGDEALRSFGVEPDIAAIDHLRETVETEHPELIDFVLDTLPYALWRDVLLVHAAPPMDVPGPAQLAATDSQMWHAAAFLASSGIADDPGYAAYRDAGVGRVVLGHVPQPAGPSTMHGDTTLLLDTNAAAPFKRGGIDWQSYVTLAHLGRGSRFHDLEVIMIDTSAAPDRAPARRAPQRRGD
jgi:3',5'-cyclic AMP phosphodiesterase CpdA